MSSTHTATPPAADEVCELNFHVSGMNCASCVSHVQKAAEAVPGVRDVNVNLALGRATIDFDPRRASPDQIASAITQSGYPTTPEAAASSSNAEQDRIARQAAHTRSWARRALVGVVLWLPVELMHWLVALAGHAHAGAGWMDWLALVTSSLAIGYVGWAFYRSAFKALLHRTSNMDTLIAMGASVAYVYSFVAFFGYLAGGWSVLPNLYFMDAAGLLALISIGHWLEAHARHAAGGAIRELLNLAPATALRLVRSSAVGEEQEPEQVPVADLQIGDRVLVRPGDRIPSDGVVIAGRSSVDESLVTGESLPVLRDMGDEVIGGTINADGRLTVRITRIGSDTALAQIIRLVDSAQSSHPPVQKLADRVAAVFVPTVLAIATITGIAWYIWGWQAGWTSAHTWAALANAVCSVLIIACPCALGLAVPAALMVGTGRGARRGILIRDIDALERAEAVNTVVLDKTGTLTEGKPVVNRIIANDGTSEDEILRLAAAAEQFSEHPLARAIVARARSKSLAFPAPRTFHNEPGLGVTAEVDGREILVGNRALIFDGAGHPAVNSDGQGQTIVHVAERRQGRVNALGSILLSDPLKSDSADAVRAMRQMNLRTVLLTGDNLATAQTIAHAAQIDDVRANVRPEGKVQAIKQLQQNARVAMVGDGINDAPALAAADLGIAVGSASDVARESGHIVLTGGSLNGVIAAIRLSRATMRIIRQNLFFAFIYNVLAIPLAAVGLLNPLISAALMGLSDISVLTNALRLRRARID